MKRLFPAYAYGEGPRAGCWWDETCDLPKVASLAGDMRCDLAVIGGGFTGLNAALELAKAGRDVVVLEAQFPGWGASGRNGGFCCLGGAKLSDAEMDNAFGKPARLDWRRAERAAVDHVRGFLERESVDADVHSEGETWLAHRARDLDAVSQEASALEENYGCRTEIHTALDLNALGLSAGFHGGITIPIGFALNPRKYVAALVRACLAAGVRVTGFAPVSDLRQNGQGWRLLVGSRTVYADQVLVATNGYSSEDIPNWLAGRFMPAQSSIIVTRPLTQNELDLQGWTSRQMCYDSRNMLHYFRLMPDNRMLFGMRGGLGASAGAERRSRQRTIDHFKRMFPAWAHVEPSHYWSGLVCLSRRYVPYVGPVPGVRGLWAGLCYHGNGVAMASYSGWLAARMISADEDRRPTVVGEGLRRFPFGRARRLLMPPVYAGLLIADL